MLVIAELRKADDWGLRAPTIEVPRSTARPSFGLLADAEIRLGLAVMKYGRYARGGRLDPGSVSTAASQPAGLRAEVVDRGDRGSRGARDAYLRKLHPQHAQFERLRQAMLTARGGKAQANPTQVRIPERQPDQARRARMRTSRWCVSGSASRRRPTAGSTYSTISGRWRP